MESRDICLYQGLCAGLELSKVGECMRVSSSDSSTGGQRRDPAADRPEARAARQKRRARAKTSFGEG